MKIWEGVEFSFEQEKGVEFFSGPEGGGEFFVMPYWQTFFLNVIKKLFS